MAVRDDELSRSRRRRLGVHAPGPGQRAARRARAADLPPRRPRRTARRARLRAPPLPGGAPVTSSAWDGRSRAPLRIGLAVAAGLDLHWLVGQLHAAAPSAATHPLAPGWLLALG